jgi:hypothetical protein
MTERKLPHSWLGLAMLLAALAAAPAAADSGVTLMHVHGLSYSADGKQLFIPSHTGLAVYSEGRWSKAPGPEHDFMGFSATRGALYSSGHPAPGSALRNPFGLVKSNDGGKTWEHLGLTGEADFHVMAASYGAQIVYVYTPGPNSRMPQPGIYYTPDDGKTWTPSGGKGLSGRIAALAVHPSRAGVLAAATESGVYVSENHGPAGDFRRVRPRRRAPVVRRPSERGDAHPNGAENEKRRADTDSCDDQGRGCLHRAEPGEAQAVRDRDLQSRCVSVE